MDYQNLPGPLLPQEAAVSCDCPNRGCTKTGIQYADISTPIDIKPHATIGEIETECLGEPEISCIEKNCDKPCKIVISQKIRIKIPVQYNVIACIGDSSIDCGCDKQCCE